MTFAPMGVKGHMCALLSKRESLGPRIDKRRKGLALHGPTCTCMH